MEGEARTKLGQAQLAQPAALEKKRKEVKLQAPVVPVVPGICQDETMSYRFIFQLLPKVFQWSICLVDQTELQL